MPHEVILTRSISQKTNEDAVKSMVHDIVRRSLQSIKGWTATVHKQGEPTKNDADLWVFKRVIKYTKTSGQMAKTQKQWHQICRSLIRLGQASRFNKYPWLVSGDGVDEIYNELVAEGRVSPMARDAESPTSTNVVGKKSTTPKPIGNINTDRGDHFDHIYDRQHQLKIIHSSIIAAKESNFINRFHCVLHGDPGCGKSDILTATGKMLGIEGEAFLKFDATSTTQAGAQKILLDSDFLPPVLMVEEIEKTDEKSLRWLLGVLDHRAEIRKTNFRQNDRRSVHMLCLATVNDIKLFRSAMSGALHSRFSHEIHCPRPNREVLGMILLREVKKVSGNEDWIEPALKFCYDDMKWNDPRKIIPVCLCGRDDLLDGTYQESLLATLPPKESE